MHSYENVTADKQVSAVLFFPRDVELITILAAFCSVWGFMSYTGQTGHVIVEIWASGPKILLFKKKKKGLIA